jgi:hypothetical protein
MRRLLLVGLIGLLAAPVSAAPPHADPATRAHGIADEVMLALGGKDAWNGTHFLRFDFAVEAGGQKRPPRSHTWDKWTGRYRLEGRTPEGDPYVVLMNVNTKQGQAWKKGIALAGDDLQKMLEKAYGAWINDTYWLLMPFKMRDPGVNLEWTGETKPDAGDEDKIVLTFGQVGLTPKDRYTVYVNRATHLVDRWDYVLQDGDKGSFLWKDWRHVGRLMLSADRVSMPEKVRIFFPVLDAPATVADSVFTTP